MVNDHYFIKLDRQYLPCCPVLVPHNVGGLLCATVLVAPGAMTRLSVAQSPFVVPGALSSKSVKSSLTWQISGIK